MKERPILYSAPMVLAKLAGRKTQTRRVVKPQDPSTTPRVRMQPDRIVRWEQNPRDGAWWAYAEDRATVAYTKPYARVGNRLWGRETWRTWERPADGLDGVIFKADNAFRGIEVTEAAADAWVVAHDNGKNGNKWRPSIFMPRWASRLLDEVVSVRVERLQDITRDDALAEGIERPQCIGAQVYNWPGSTLNFLDPRDCYLAGWDTINGERAPATSNPWVWVIETMLVSTAKPA